MLLRRRQGDSPNFLATARDLVEIVAILAAGIWAFYIFVYENRWLPAQQPPRLTFTASMQHLSTHEGLETVRALVRVQNIGSVKVQFLAFSVTIIGSQVRAAAKRSPDQEGPVNTLERYYTITGAVPIYRLAYLTHGANSAYSTDYFLESGELSEREIITYVPVGQFNRLNLVISGLYTKSKAQPIPTTVVYGKDGVPMYSVLSNSSDITRVQASFASLDLPSR